MASDSEVILQRLVSVTLNILISTSTYYHTAIILIFIFLAILGSVLYSCYLSITPTSDSIPCVTEWPFFLMWFSVPAI